MKSAPFNAMEEFKNEYRCIVTDLRNAHGGRSPSGCLQHRCAAAGRVPQTRVEGFQ
jgi:hypothetical protein